MPKNPKLIDKWFSGLPAEASRVLLSTVALCTQSGSPVYLVGGTLRDLLLGHPSLDIDITIERDAPEIAAQLESTAEMKTVMHQQFRTAAIVGPGWRVDLTTARQESYRRPGALPRVQPATIREDLARRDFSINAMALRLDGPQRGLLLDPHGGRADLDSRLVRVLHEASFRDDATRILRAARYAARLRFRIEIQTSRWLERDARYLATISPARLHHEFARIAAEEEPEGALVQLDSREVLRFIYPTLRYSEEQEAALREARLEGAPSPTFWPLLAFSAFPGPANSLSSRLDLTRAQRESVEGIPRLLARLASLLDTENSSLVAALDTFPLPTVWAVALLVPGAGPRLREYLKLLRHVRPRLRGEDLIGLGLPAGPRLGQALQSLKDARLDGRIKTQRDEVNFVQSLLAGAVPA